MPAEELLAPIPDAVLGRAPVPDPVPVAEVTAQLTGDSLVLERPATAVPEPAEISPPAAAPADTGRTAEPIPTVTAEVAGREEPRAAREPAAPPPDAPVKEDGPSAAQLMLVSVAGNLFAAAGWAFSLGIVLALGWIAIYHRTGIMHAWPPSQRLFNWLGLA